ncbi:MAG: hypothetical protein LBL59_04065 [Xanthomonadaceae bacterium]|jgi:hypothetical protein|nr:hypothetical protein [Xanthomonadaceae bacterium]
MKSRLPLTVLLIALVAACKPTDPGNSPQNPPGTRSAPQAQATPETAAEPAPAPVDCPAAAFSDFLPLFFNDESIQRKYTAFPLERYYMGEDGDAESTEHVDESDVEFPLVKSTSELRELGLLLDIESASDDRAEVKEWQDGTGYQYRYIFEKDGCWKLTRIEDRSI